ncbi:MAG: hypothetical protein H6Q26_2498, partial [Bacteroidetes bacterium]|nr:hypothetical protein [Bacteroidota bacterium]
MKVRVLGSLNIIGSSLLNLPLRNAIQFLTLLPQLLVFLPAPIVSFVPNLFQTRKHTCLLHQVLTPMERLISSPALQTVVIWNEA